MHAVFFVLWIWECQLVTNQMMRLHVLLIEHYLLKYEGVFEKKQDCANNYFITNENSKLQHAPLKLVSLSPDALLHSPPLCILSLLGGFFRDALNSFVTTLLMVVESWKWVSFNTPLNLGKWKVSLALNPVSTVVAPA